MRLIDADAWFERIDSDHCASCSRVRPCSECGLGIARESIENTPTLDAVPVVRCKDCKYYKTESGECPANNGDDPYYSWIPKPDWYCAEGKRKEDA